MRHAAPEVGVPDVELRLDGAPIDLPLSSTLHDVVLSELLNRPARLRLAVHDPEGEWQRRVLNGSPAVELRAGKGGEPAWRSLFSGTLVRIEADLAPNESLTLHLTALDPLHRLGRSFRHRSFPATTDVALAGSLAQEHGLRLETELAGVSVGHVVQDGKSDLSLLRHLCERTGRDFLVREGALHWRRLPAAGVEPIVLEWGGALERASVEAVRVGVPERVVLRSRDVLAATTLEVSSRASATAMTSAAAASPEPGRRVTHEDASHGSAESLESRAEALLERARRRRERFEGWARGEAGFRAGACIRVTAAGAPIDGDWCLDRVEHRLGANSGWTTALFGFRI